MAVNRRTMKENVKDFKYCWITRVLAATRDTIEMTKKMADVGADAVLVVTPCYYKSAMNNEALYQHFHNVRDKLLFTYTSINIF